MAVWDDLLREARHQLRGISNRAWEPEDLLMAALLRALEAGTYDPERPVLPYMRQIIRRVAASERERKSEQFESADALEVLPEGLSCQAWPIERVVRARMLIRRLMEHCGTDVAVVLGLAEPLASTPGAARTRRWRARERLRMALRDLIED